MSDSLVIDAHSRTFPYSRRNEIAGIGECIAEDVVEQCRTRRWHQPDRAIELFQFFVAPKQIRRVKSVVSVVLVRPTRADRPAELVNEDFFPQAERLVEQIPKFVKFMRLNKEIHVGLHLMTEANMLLFSQPINTWKSAPRILSIAIRVY
ncbi:hypothetical protein AGR3A_pa10061 [Agrobacterium tomkonis CFBP 6623]|uniref:Uncharacterized protein n=1 Tax=Agrobacterium tomkonis CFBP 6623 TaxID=1183432 RepID=A0A1S7S846_9HYPH|nr:hypothetical protein AGR3A_pa10061 [Agrobacterium tomkonis CFBP 6623]